MGYYITLLCNLTNALNTEKYWPEVDHG